jgi:hypothetical protein
MKRRTFLATTTAAATASLFPAIIVRGEEKQNTTLGQGDFKYRVVSDWIGLSVTSKTQIKNCHGIVEDKSGHLIMVTDHVKNNVIIFDKGGKLVSHWTLDFPGAHGLSIVTEGEGKDAREVLFITDIRIGKVVKTTLDGEVLQRWGWPEDSGKYDHAKQYRPSWTLHKPSGEFFILDGYGKDYVQHFDEDGKQVNLFGGNEGGIAHWGPHGGIYDDGLLIAMSDQQYLMHLSDSGKQNFRIHLPGGNPRQIHKTGDHYFVAHLADNWPKDRNSPGYVSVLDKTFKVVSNIDGSAPQIDGAGKLAKMSATGNVFTHPHDLCVGKDGSVYVAQFLSGGTYPIKLERV